LTISFLSLDKNTVIHRLDPRTKFFAVICVTIMSLEVSRSLIILVGMLLFMVPMFIIAKTPKRTIATLVYISCLMTIGLSLTFGFIAPRETSFSWRLPVTGITFMIGPFTYYYDGFIYALGFALKTSIPIFFAIAVLTSTTDPNKLLVALSDIGIPDDVAFVVSTAFRLIPLFAEEWANIRDAILVRGAQSGGISRIRFYRLMLEPLMIGALRRSREMSYAIEARAFGTRRRTHMTKLIMRGADYGVLAISLSLVCIFLVFGGFGLGLI
jgi:energy-coupling factor transport system permease protein